MKATNPDGTLKNIENCYIKIPNYGTIPMRILPDISDSKSAQYSDEPIIGRSMPMKTYSHSENRTINWTAYFMILKNQDAEKNLMDLRALQSVTYPRDDFEPYAPPPICAIKCGSILGDQELCVVLKTYSVKFPTDVAWDENLLVPYKFSVDLTWDVVYSSDDLPGNDRILRGGR